MGALKGTGVFMKKWQKILIGVIVVCVALIAANGLTMKGFCYTLSYPGGEMIFMEKVIVMWGFRVPRKARNFPE